MPDPIVVQRMNEFRAALLQQDSAAQVEMARRWRAVERRLQSDINAVLEEIRIRQAAGEVFGRYDGPYTRLNRYGDLLSQIRVEISRYAEIERQSILDGIATRAAQGVEDSTQAILAAADGSPAILAQFNRLDRQAIANMVANIQSDSPLGELLAQAWPDAATRLTDALINGTALGWNPRKTARAMREGLQQGALQRVLRIARTEQLRAYRTATLNNYRNSQVVRGYKRLAAKSRRTCIACLLLDGRVYATEDAFAEHPNGRCTLVPLLIGLPDAEWDNGRDWFLSQSGTAQRQILGQGAYNAWQGGAIGLDDLIALHDHPIWGAAYTQRSLRDILGFSEAQRWYAP